IDTVFTDIADLDGLRRECEDGVAMGFTGKISIHPNQIPVINEAFSPSKEALDEARQLVALFEEHARRGVYAFTFKGQMVDALHIVEGELPSARPSIVPGHQVIGRVERTGSIARRFQPGDRVGIAWLRGTCGACEACRGGRENLCERAEFTGYHADGGFADYAVVSEAFAYAIPPVFGDAEAAPLLCAGIIGYRALKRSEERRVGKECRSRG